MSDSNDKPNRQARLLELHNRLMSDDPLATNDIFEAVVPELETHLRIKFPNLAPSVDPDIYTSAVFDALTDYFKNPNRYDHSKSGLMTYLRMVATRDMQNLLAKESRHAKGKVSFEDVEFDQSDGNDIAETVANGLYERQLMERLTQDMKPAESAVLRLMMEGERSTAAAVKLLGIEHLPTSEQAKEVKRVKDRIKKRIQRKGVVLS